MAAELNRRYGKRLMKPFVPSLAVTEEALRSFCAPGGRW